MKPITRGLSRKLLAAPVLQRREIFPAWTPAMYKRVFEGRWSYRALFDAGQVADADPGVGFKPSRSGEGVPGPNVQQA